MKQTNFEKAEEWLDNLPLQTLTDELKEDIKNEFYNDKIEYFKNNTENLYVLVEWPESQDFMEEEWFQEEAVCAVGSEDRFGSAAYFIPIKRII